MEEEFFLNVSKGYQSINCAPKKMLLFIYLILLCFYLFMFEDTLADNDEDWNAKWERKRGIWMATTKAIEWVR